MGRNIITKRSLSALESKELPAAPETPDNYATQIIKLIPALREILNKII